MIDVVLFSISGSQEIPEITELLERWYESPIVPNNYKDVLKYTLDIVREGGHYPTKEYYELYFQDTGQYYASVTELLHYAKIADDYFERVHLQEEVTKIFNSAKSADDMRSMLTTVLDSDEGLSEDDEFSPKLYSDLDAMPHSEGIKSGIGPIDQLTNGFQPTTVPTIAAFTAHGKSTCWNSIMFKSALSGKKVVCLSLEMAPEILWLQLEARYMYEVKNLQITSSDLIQRKLSKEMKAKVQSFEPDFKKDIVSNILIVDSSVLKKEMKRSSTAWINLYKKWDKRLGGLDLVVHDHVGQYERLFPEEGNNIIKMITDATVRFRSRNGTGVVSGFACQTNREGYKRALRNRGVYDLTAISDLNEVERASTYVIFLFTPEESLLSQETLVTMAKHRLGGILSEPTPVAFIPSVSIVGSNVDQISYEDDLSSLDGDFGSFDSLGGDFDI